MGVPNRRQMFSTQSLSPGSSYIVNRNIVIHNLLTAPLHLGNENPTRLANNNMDHQSTGDAAKKGGQNTSMNWVQRVIKGALPCVAGTAVAPLERVYTLIQCQNDIVKKGHLTSPYKGMKDCFLRTIRHEGFSSLWRGNSVNVLSMLGFQVLSFTVPRKEPSRSVSDVPLARFCLSIMIVNVFTYPLQYAQVRLMNDVKPVSGIVFSLDSTKNTAAARRQFSSALDVVHKTLKSDGFRGLYRGYTPTCIRTIAYIQANLANLEILQAYTKDKQNRKTRKFWASVGSLCMFLGVIPVALYPMSTVSSRMMMTSCEAYKYKGAMHAFFQIIRNEGVCSLYKGFTPFLICSISKAGILLVLNNFMGFTGVGMSRTGVAL